MSEKKWKIEYQNEPMFNIDGGKLKNYQNGYYTISFENSKYGSVSKKAFDEMKTSELLPLIEQMLNDAHDLALRQHD